MKDRIIVILENDYCKDGNYVVCSKPAGDNLIIYNEEWVLTTMTGAIKYIDMQTRLEKLEKQ
jgi:hypothetical protein